MKQVLVLAALCCSFAVSAQTNIQKLQTGLKKIVGEYLVDFKTIKGEIIEEDETMIVYKSKFALTGMIDSTVQVLYYKEDKTWRFVADANLSVFTSDNINEAIKATTFSFGKMKGIASGVEWVWDFIPAKKLNATDKIKKLCISVYDGTGREEPQQLVRLSIYADGGYKDK